MTPAEQDAFVNAYTKYCSYYVHPTKIAKFVEEFANGGDINYAEDYGDVMDALLMWMEAQKWAIEQLKEGETA